jgi:hypothetical protein
MASRSSRPRNASAHDPKVLQRLLQDGAVLETPNKHSAAAADELARLGLIDVARFDFVLCVNPRDDDFPPPQRDCRGRIWVREGRNEDHCPECGRLVFPNDSLKHRYPGLQVRVRVDGIMGYLAQLATAFGEHNSPVPGVLRCRAEPDDILICVADLCRDAYYLSSDTAAVRPMVLVTLGPGGGHSMLRENWRVSTTLAEIVAGKVNLPALLRRAAAQETSERHTRGLLPIYTAGIPHAISSSSQGSTAPARLELEVTDDRARVQGIVVADQRAKIQLVIMQILWDEFRRWFLNGRFDEPEPMLLERIAEALEHRTGVERAGVEAVRRPINRLQAKIARLLQKHLNLPVGTSSVIETVRWRGGRDGYGYRYNSKRVSLVAAGAVRAASVGKK